MKRRLENSRSMIEGKKENMSGQNFQHLMSQLEIIDTKFNECLDTLKALQVDERFVGT
jgi:hypothetical protein